MTEAYLLIDLSSSAVRAYVVTPDGQKRAQKSRAIHNVRDPKYADALSFDPNLLQQDLISVCAEAVAAAGEVCIVAVSATSAREGIVLLDADTAIFCTGNAHVQEGRIYGTITIQQGYRNTLSGFLCSRGHIEA